MIDTEKRLGFNENKQQKAKKEINKIIKDIYAEHNEIEQQSTVISKTITKPTAATSIATLTPEPIDPSTNTKSKLNYIIETESEKTDEIYNIPTPYFRRRRYMNY
ncbi:MAG: hypothetical protein Ta2E_00540 [Mycoplasmoidaceae bacterium]|nr:MAG: hypothetical protein Ta2E_00540 [Mycoplasmoidaceae bacterium]